MCEQSIGRVMCFRTKARVLCEDIDDSHHGG